MAHADLALVRRFPAIARMPRVLLTALPTPVERLPGRLAPEVELWVKRDDRSGRRYGGNKPRKLEWIVGDALARGRETLLTFGGIGTHHGLATLLAAHDHGLATILVLVPQPVTAPVRHTLLLLHAFGAELHLARSVPHAVAITTIRLARALVRGERVAIVPPGGSSALGTIGYVNAALELAEQIRAGDLPAPDAIFVPLGSGGTLAGLVAGARLAGLSAQIVGVSVTDVLPPSPRRIAHLARAALARLRRFDPTVPRVAIAPRDATVLGGYVGRGYGDPTEASRSACALAAAETGLTLDTTYTGKCFAALLAAARAPAWRGRRMLFWHTFSAVDPGGTLARLPDERDLPAPVRDLLRAARRSRSR